MRYIHPIDALIPGTRQKILAATLRSPDRWWYLSDIARHLSVSPSTLQRELASLVKANILNQRYEGKNTYFKVDKECPFFPELQRLFLKTAGLVDVLRDALVPHRNIIQCAFIYGSVAEGQETSKSDVDVMVIGDVGLSTIALPFRNVQEIIQRTVNSTIFTPAEFKKRVKAKNHFLRNVRSKDKIFILGNDTDLERIAGTTSSGAASRR